MSAENLEWLIVVLGVGTTTGAVLSAHQHSVDNNGAKATFELCASGLLLPGLCPGTAHRN